MNLKTLRFGALSTQVTPNQSGHTIQVKATGPDLHELLDVFHPRTASNFLGEEGVVINIPENGRNFDFKLQDVKSGNTHEAQGQPELLGLYKLFEKLAAKGDINSGTYAQLIHQVIVRNGGSIVLASMPADPKSVMAAIERDYQRTKKFN